jgi:hypothetical protein
MKHPIHGHGGTQRIAAVPWLVCGAGPLPPRGAAEDESFGAVAKSYFEKAISSAKSLVSGKENETDEAEAETAEESEEAVLEKAVKAATAQIFHKEGTQ